MKLSAGLMAIIAATYIEYNPDIVTGKRKKGIYPNPNMNPYGLTKFIIDGQEVLALNLKNAKRKANKI